MPTWDYDPTTPSQPSPWTSEQAGYYYVNGSTGTDSGRTYGTPTAPRLTIPNPVPAGAKVWLAGTYNVDYTGTALDFEGTSGSPCFLSGVSGLNVTASWIITGSYAIIEKLGVTSGGIIVLDPSDHITVRDSDVHGTLAGEGGVSVNTWNDGNASNIAILRNVIHYAGDWETEADQDAHGTGVYCSTDSSGTLSYIWIIGNTYSYNSGDGIQINARAGNHTHIHHVYVGGNVAHHNKQTGFWTKEAEDVVFSQNVSHDHTVSPSSGGQGMGWQYSPHRVWYIFNESYNNEIGIGHASADSGATGIYYVGNLCHDNTTAGMEFNGSPDTAEVVLHNTLANNPTGLHNAYYAVRVALSQNIFASCSSAHLNFSEGIVTASVLECLFDSPLDVVWDGASYSSLAAFQSGTGTGTGCVVGSPDFVSSSDYNLGASSAAIGIGSLHAAYATYLAAYGVSIAKDRDGRDRPLNTTWDAGAYERP